MSWYSANKAWAVTWFVSDHPSRPDKSCYWRSTSFLLSTDILVHWIPCISSSSSNVLGVNSTGGRAFTATAWVTLMSLVIVIRMATRFFTTTTAHLLPEITSVYMFTTLRLWGKWGPSSPFRTWVITFMLFPWSMVFIQPCIILDEKVSTSSLFVILTASFKSVWSTVWCIIASPLIKSSARQHASNWAILNPFREADNSSISLSLITLMIQLMVAVPRVAGAWDPIMVESGTTKVTWSSSYPQTPCTWILMMM